MKNGKTDLRIHGDHKGQKNLLPDPSGSLQKNGTFNRSPNVFKQCQRPMLSNNIGVIYEGISIGYAHGSIKPFKPFSKDSEGGISALFYPANISVSAPFSRRCQSTTYVIRTANSREEMATLSSQDINVLQSIDSISSYMQFIENFSCLERAFQAATLGKEKNDDLVSKLERLRKNIDVTNLNKQQKSDFINKFNVLMRMANGALRGSFTMQEMAAAKRGET